MDIDTINNTLYDYIVEEKMNFNDAMKIIIYAMVEENELDKEEKILLKEIINLCIIMEKENTNLREDNNKLIKDMKELLADNKELIEIIKSQMPEKQLPQELPQLVH